jgi:hypothetical protein
MLRANTPNAETQAAMQEAEAGRAEPFESLDALFHSWKQDAFALPLTTRHCEHSEAIQQKRTDWIATSATPPRNDGSGG